MNFIAVQRGYVCDQRLGQMGLGGLAGAQALAQLKAQPTPGFDPGDDAGLFSEGW